MFGHRYFGASYFGPAYWGPASGTVTPPTPTPSTAYPARRRYEVQRRNGEIITVSSEADLELLLRQIRAEKPKKRSRKIKRAFEAEPLQDLPAIGMGAVLALMAEQASERITEAALLAIMADMLMRQAEDEEEAILLLLS